MSNTKSKLVFDFPDPSPRFDFDDSPQKRAGNKLKSTGRFKLKSSVGRASPKKAGSSPSPDKTNSTATTASASSFDESAFDDFDDEVFDFGMKRNGGSAQPAAGAGVRGASPSAKSAAQIAQHSDISTPSSKPSFEFADSTPHKPLKLPNNHQQHGMHKRTHSTHSNTGYISEVSEFSFDRVTVNTVQTGLTGVSSNVSWNFFEEAKDLGMLNNATGMDKHGLGFVPYTGNSYNDDGDVGGANNGGSSGHVKKSLDIRSLLSDDAPNTNAANTASQNNHPFNNNNNNNNNSHHRQIKINMDQISLSDQSNELPISGIVSSSNQSIISEISDVNMDNEEEKLDEVVKMLNENEKDDYRKTPPPPAAAASSSQIKTNTTPTSLNYSEDPASKQDQSSPPSIFKQIEQYKMQRLSRQQQREGIDGNNSRSSKINNNNNNNSNNANTENNSNNSMFETVMSNVWIGLGFCTWYLCGTDTTQCQGKNNNNTTMNKEERQKEMDDRFLGKLIFCNCHDLGCGMSNVL